MHRCQIGAAAYFTALSKQISLLAYSPLAFAVLASKYLWERACPANTGKAGAMHRVAPFAGQARSHSDHCCLRDNAAKELGNFLQKSMSLG